MDFLDRAPGRTLPFPKIVDPATHSALDYLTVSYFMIVARLFWGRHRRAATTALSNGGMVLGLSMLTDYPGGRKRICFRKHGKRDILQAIAAAGLPMLMGFADTSAALPFQLQALNQSVVIAITDYDSEPARAHGNPLRQRKAAWP